MGSVGHDRILLGDFALNLAHNVEVALLVDGHILVVPWTGRVVHSHTLDRGRVPTEGMWHLGRVDNFIVLLISSFFALI